ncbi:chemotaxis protein CheB [Dokdonella sp.]|uniref:chemotaxis protein CheB n=1 Tax=Dokdonella sp. TaxID=2291710 RepID=UPI001B0059C3|nr:chemotaxis protein CheB [Dokdonella sp.]MBO9665126.1 chemotaxis protein CheB [Dokdonella sp.]
MSSTHDVAVALLSDTPEHGAHLREALLALGAPVVYETSMQALDRAALERSHANVVVINLDAQGGPQLDDLDGLLADARYRVVFNEAEVSSGLSGWDQARWARHLAAKVLGEADTDPPRPADAEAVPSREAMLFAEAPRAAQAIELPPLEDIAPVEEEMDFVDQLSAGLAPNTADALVEQVAPVADDEVEKLLLEPFDLVDFDRAAAEEANHSPVIVPALESTSGGLGEVDAAAIGEFDVQEFAIDPALLAAFDEEAAAAKEETASAASPAWSLEDMLEEAEPAPRPAAAFGIEKLSAEEFLAPAVEEASTAAPRDAAPESAFALELIPLEEAVAPASVELEPRESWLDPDAVTAPAKVRRVWVLGASIGGPESVREFLGELPRDYPALFLLAQHLGGEFVDLMARQLAKATPMTVRLPTHGERIGHGEVAVVPATHRLLVDAEGVIVLERDAERGEYSPSIDRVLRDVADRFGDAAGAIIFSGMSDDAIEGCQYLAAKGGRVYVQDPDTCVTSAMVDGVRESGVVGFVGSPRELAEQLLAEAKQSQLRQGV